MKKITINIQELASNKLAKIYREKIEDYFIIGYPLIYNGDIILLHYAYDIMLDGYKFIRTDDITNIEKNSENMNFLNNIYRNEDIAPVFPQGFENVKTIRDIINVLKDRETVCIIESEIKEVFAIGKITDVSNNTVSVLGFDAKCRVDDDVTIFPIDEITAISFGGRYSEIMGKYVNW